MKNKIEAVLRETDPMGLIRSGAPDDEYSSESKALSMAVTYQSSVDFIHQALWNVFYNSFCHGDIYQTDQSSGEFVKVGESQRSIEEAPSLIGEFSEYRVAAEKIKEILKIDSP